MQRKIGRFIPNTNENKGGGVIKLKHKGIVSELKYNKNNEIYGKVKCPNVCNITDNPGLIIYHYATRNFDKEQWKIKKNVPTKMSNPEQDLSNIHLIGLGDTKITYETSFAKLTSFHENFRGPNYASNSNYYQYYIFELNLDKNTIKIVGYMHFFIKDDLTNRVLFHEPSKTLTLLENTKSKIESDYESFKTILKNDVDNNTKIYNDIVSSFKSLSADEIGGYIGNVNNIENLVKSLYDKESSNYILIPPINKSSFVDNLGNFIFNSFPLLENLYKLINEENGINNSTIKTNINEFMPHMNRLGLNDEPLLKKNIDEIYALIKDVDNEEKDLITTSILIFTNVFEIILCILNQSKLSDDAEILIDDKTLKPELKTNIQTLLIGIALYIPEFILYLNDNITNITDISKNPEEKDFNLIISYLDCNYKLASKILLIAKNTIGNDSTTASYLNKTLDAYNQEFDETSGKNTQDSNNTEPKKLYIKFSNNILKYLDIKYKNQPIKNVQEILDQRLRDVVYDDNLMISVKNKYRSDNFSEFKIFNNSNNERICYMWDFYGGGVPDDNWECFYNYFFNIKIMQENGSMIFSNKFNLIKPSKSFAYTTSKSGNTTYRHYYICDIFNEFEDKLNEMITNENECSEMNLQDDFPDGQTTIIDELNTPGDFVTLD